MASRPDPAMPQSEGGRKKKFTTRSRTGCFTCRKRRVKCDEATPACRRCTIAGIPCHYGTLIPYDNVVQPAKLKPAYQAAHNQRAQSQATRERRIYKEAEPPDWDHLQAIRYSNFQNLIQIDLTVINPMRAAGTGSEEYPEFTPTMGPYITANVIVVHLGVITKAYGRPLIYGEGSELTQVWKSYTLCLTKIIALVNSCFQVATATSRESAMKYMGLLMFMDFAVESKLWQAHVDGCYAFVQSIGGAQAMMDWEPATPPIFRRFLRGSTLYNTTTPALRHSLGYDNYTDAQLEFFLRDEEDFCADRPFPVQQRIILIQLTRLRHRIATAEIKASSPTLTSIITGLYEQLHDIDLDDWAQSLPGFGFSMNLAMAEIHQDAIWLYAILTLPRAAMLDWARAERQRSPLGSVRATGNAGDAYDNIRTYYTLKVMVSVRRVFPLLQYPAALNWPLTVVGVAVTDEEDRAFVDRALDSLWRRPVGAGGSYLVLERLREFWPTGKTEWEDCFYEPTPC
ncbi:hypothetical protein NLG97_g4855 [Lecanicillium saksenae]|uniref:Uncharacterized protein n=1 Tax=Lecanicillium saksenae TaxID=468837 RepID=A0ACC1QU39_9HYPO|nr:hypothetical protein NLG97_g4855 [Lecanicillium saksenae]